MINIDQISIGDIVRTTERSIFMGSIVKVVDKLPGQYYPFHVLDEGETVPIMLEEIEEIVFTI